MKTKTQNTCCNSCQGSVTRKHSMLLILKHPMGRAVVLLVPGAQRNCGAATPREWEWVPCPGAYQSGSCWRCFPLPLCLLLSPCVHSAWPGHFSVSPGKYHLLLFLVSGTLGDPGDHLPCFQAANMLTAGLPGKFKMHL